MTPKIHHWDWIQERPISLSLSLNLSFFPLPPTHPSTHTHTHTHTKTHPLTSAIVNKTCAPTIPYSPFQCTCAYNNTEKKHKQKIQAMGSNGTQNSLNKKHPKDNPKNNKKKSKHKMRSKPKDF